MGDPSEMHMRLNVLNITIIIIIIEWGAHKVVPISRQTCTPLNFHVPRVDQYVVVL